MDNEARELALYIINDSQLYNQQTEPIIKNLKRKIKKGVYDKDKALILWKLLADSGAKKYHKEFGSASNRWYEIFNVPVRKETAKILSENYFEEISENPRKGIIEKLKLKYIVYSYKGKMYQHKFNNAIMKIRKNSFTVTGNFKYDKVKGFLG